MSVVSRIRVVALVSAILSLALVGLGGYVRATGAGLACPDWPLCFGRVIPELSGGVAGGVVQEYFHRVLAGVIGLLAIFLAVLCFRVRREQTAVYKLSVFLLILVIVQAVFGGLTVIMKLNPFVVTTHLVLGTIYFQVLALLALDRDRKVRVKPLGKTLAKPFADIQFRNLLHGLVALVFIQIALGGFVGSSGASLACIDFPLCNGEVIPANASGPVIVQILHRLLAFVILFGVLAGLVMIRRCSDEIRARKGHYFGMVFLVTLQVALGIHNVLMKIPVSTTVLHLVFAQLLLLGLGSLLKDLKPALRIFRPIDQPRQAGQSGAGLREQIDVEYQTKKVAY